MNLQVTPEIGLVDEPLIIRLTGLNPNDKVKITASMSLPWEPSEQYESHSCFTADAQGIVDLSRQKPDTGDYNWIDSMGLIASLRKVRSAGANIAQNLSTETPMCIDLCAECSSGKETETVTRLFRNANITRKKIDHGFVGELFHTGDASKPTVMVLGGSGGGMEPLALIAGPLASHGFNVLNVGYFGEEGLPPYLQDIPLEYFEGVVNWILNNPSLSSKIYLHGTSKGGELALLLASRYDVYSKVVANLPHAYCFQGLQGMAVADGVSSWSYNGQSLPYIELDNAVFFEQQQECVRQGKPFGLTGCHVKGLDLAQNKAQARIKVENSHADLLLIAGEKDNMWNTYDGCREIIESLDQHQYPHQYKLLSYGEMGHTSIPVPYVVPLSETMEMKLMGGVFSNGGTLEGNAYGQCQAWKNTIDFLKS